MLSKNPQIFSPQNFSEYVGQDRAKKIASIMVSAAKIKREPLSSILISGSYGTGKSSLAKVIRKESGKPVNIIDAAALGTDFYYDKDFIIDEIHNIDPKIADSISILMDQGKASIIGCTTNPGALSGAFKSRFRPIELEKYNLDDIKRIVTHIFVGQGIDVDGSTVTDISKRSRLNPRTAINNLSFILDYMTVQGLSSVPSRLAREAFSTLGIDPNGFTQRDHDYMAILSDKPLGVNSLSSRLGIDAQTIEREIEPYLLQLGYIDRMPRGRIKLKDL